MTRPLYAYTATFQDLQDLLAQEGCALCAHEAQSARRWLDALLHEDVTSPETEAQLRASAGFCPRHTHQLIDRRDPLAVALIYRSLLLPRWRALDPETRHGRDGTPLRAQATTCPLCLVEHESAQRAAEVLALGLEQGTLRAPWEASGGLCWPHFLVVRGRCRKPGRALLDGLQHRRLGELLADLETLVASFDYRFTGTRAPQTESAWRRAAAVMAGRPAGVGPSATPPVGR